MRTRRAHHSAVPLLSLAALLGGCPGRGTSEDAGVTDAAPDTSADVLLAEGSPPEAAAPPRAASAPLLQWVDPRLGTGGDGFGTGSAFPGPQRPFGLARPGPDTVDEAGNAVLFSHCAGYSALDEYVSAFSQVHMHGTGIVDYGHLGVMPTRGATAGAPPPRARMRAGTERAQPSYYSVELDVGAPAAPVRAELTATERVSVLRFTFPAGDASSAVAFDLGHQLSSVRVVSATVDLDATAQELSGQVLATGGYSDRCGGVRLFFVARSSAGLAGLTLHGDAATATHAEGPNARAVLPLRAGGALTVALGLSYVDVAHARANLDAEARDLDFDRLRREGEAQWESQLSRAQIEGRSEADFRQFYTALYHSLLMPSLASDVDGAYRGIDGQVHNAQGFTYYTDLSLWDTYRTEHPWLALLYPERQRDVVRSLVAMADASGRYPRWPLGTCETGGMLGDPGALVVADSYLRGVRDFDAEHAFALARTAALDASSPNARDQLHSYLSLGYIAMEDGGSSAARTLEYAWADGALASFALALGHAEDAQRLTRSASNWRNLLDPSNGFLVGRHRDGSFASVPTPTTWQDFYAEGNAWQYQWLAPHAFAELAQAMGGTSSALAQLDRLFRASQRSPRTAAPDPYYWQGNEPDIHAPWLYAAYGDGERAARWVSWVRTTRYGLGPDGLPGNDDAGTMSAWYLFAALGFYPLAGTDQVLLSAPIFTRAVLTPPVGPALTIAAPEADGSGQLPVSVRLGNAVLERPSTRWADLRSAGSLSFQLRAP